MNQNIHRPRIEGLTVRNYQALKLVQPLPEGLSA